MVLHTLGVVVSAWLLVRWIALCSVDTDDTNPLCCPDAEPCTRSPEQPSGSFYSVPTRADTSTTEDTEAAADRIAKHVVRDVFGDSGMTSSADLRDSRRLRESTASCTSKLQRGAH